MRLETARARDILRQLRYKNDEKITYEDYKRVALTYSCKLEDIEKAWSWYMKNMKRFYKEL